ncbi:MAG: GlmU family protein [Flavobacteriales bacterium]|jgi:UDP-N-acetylglucosamine diphosphorylase/glucosamine-1-phosphate N-acetyltransferase|nr:GlmU family protein [Flavobacteriales bacterium]
MDVILFDGAAHQSLWPISATKPVAKIRVGILTIEEKWNYYLTTNTTVRTKDYLSAKYDANNEVAAIGLYAGVLPTLSLVKTIKGLPKGQILMQKGRVLAISPMPSADANMEEVLSGMKIIEYSEPLNFIDKPWDIFTHNHTEIVNDFEIIKETKEAGSIDDSNRVIGNQLFVEKGAKVSCATINTLEGPVFIGKNAQVLEGSLIKGSLALCENAVLKMGAKIYGGTTIGPYAKVGGEVSNSVIQGYSNKGHDGYLGNSVLGEWCNLGADTNTSNLKNNYSNVKVWDYTVNETVDTGLQFCGLIMGDHSKSGINTMFNTGTVVGVCANIFGGGFPQKFIPSYSWGGADGFDTFKLDKAYEVAEKVMNRRKIELTKNDKNILKDIFDLTSKFRS